MEKVGGVLNAGIYRGSPADGVRELLPRTAFDALSITERSLQEWVLASPELLGEELLVITHEYAGFDRSHKRPDILALDKAGKLVVVELKLATTGSFADLQGINYAAMVSTMTMQQALDLYEKQHEVDSAAAEDEVRGFLELGDDELPDLDDQPRIIIAAGSFGGYEITSTALWLRTFGVDIKLVEVAPYTASADDFILVPRIVIPIPEAEEYMVGHERKESAQRGDRKVSRDKYRNFLELVRELAMKTELQALLKGEDEWMKNTSYGFPAIQSEDLSGLYYKWAFSTLGFTVGLHFERIGDSEWNQRTFDWFTTRMDELENGGLPELEVLRDKGIQKWLGYTLVPAGEVPDLTEERAEEAVEVMLRLHSLTAEHVPDAVRHADGVMEASMPDVQVET